VDIPANASFTETPGPLVLFASGQYSNGELINIGNIGDFRVYSLKIWRNGALVRDFVPVRRAADNVVTLADAVEGGVLEPIAAGDAGNIKFGGGPARDMTVSPFAAAVPPQLSREGAPEARPVLSVTDAATGKLYRRELPIDYYVNANFLRLSGENMDGSVSQLVFLSARGIERVKDITGKGPDHDRCGTHGHE
jgi:hypothetical protein